MEAKKSRNELGRSRVEELVRTVWNYMDVSTPTGMLPKVPIVFVPGSMDMLTAQRAAELYRIDKTDRIVFSGYNVLNSNLIISEARALAKRAVDCGVQRDAIILEEKSKNTGENIAFTYELLSRMEIKPQSIVVVQKPYALGRIRSSLLRQWPSSSESPQPKFYMSAMEMDVLDYIRLAYDGKMHASTIVGNMLADFQRMHIWTSPPNDFMVKVEVAYGRATPENVKDAYRELVDRGFDSPRLLRDNHSQIRKPLEI